MNFAEGLRRRGLAPQSLYAWLLGYPCIWAFSDARDAMAAIQKSGLVYYPARARNKAAVRRPRAPRSTRRLRPTDRPRRRPPGGSTASPVSNSP